jgi:hypothetical protein
LKESKQPLFEKSGAKTFVHLGLGMWHAHGTLRHAFL